MSLGLAFAILGAALAAGLAGVGSAGGVQFAGKAAAGVTAEKPELFGKLLVLQALPATQGIYGFIAAILIMSNSGIMGGTVELTVSQGLGFLFASLPIAVTGLFSGIYQGKTAAAAIQMTGKDPSTSGKGITMTAMVETYAILALLITILLTINVKI